MGVSWDPQAQQFGAGRGAFAHRCGGLPGPLGHAGAASLKNDGDIRTDTLWWTNIAIENGHRNSGFSQL